MKAGSNMKEFYGDKRVVITFVNGQELLIRNIHSVQNIGGALIYECPHAQYTVQIDKVNWAVVEKDICTTQAVPNSKLESLWCYDQNGCPWLRPLNPQDVTEEDRKIHNIIIEELKSKL